MSKLTNILNKIAEAQRGGDSITPVIDLDEKGACCTPIGGCTNTTATACTEIFGEFYRYNSCSENPCHNNDTGRCCVYTNISGVTRRYLYCSQMSRAECSDVHHNSQELLIGVFAADYGCSDEPFCEGSDEWNNESVNCCTRCTYTDVNDGTTYDECNFFVTREECRDRNGQDNFIPGWKCSAKEVGYTECRECDGGVEFKDKFDVNR